MTTVTVNFFQTIDEAFFIPHCLFFEKKKIFFYFFLQKIFFFKYWNIEFLMRYPCGDARGDANLLCDFHWPYVNIDTYFCIFQKEERCKYSFLSPPVQSRAVAILFTITIQLWRKQDKEVNLGHIDDQMKQHI